MTLPTPRFVKDVVRSVFSALDQNTQPKTAETQPKPAPDKVQAEEAARDAMREHLIKSSFNIG